MQSAFCQIWVLCCMVASPVCDYELPIEDCSRYLWRLFHRRTKVRRSGLPWWIPEKWVLIIILEWGRYSPAGGWLTDTGITGPLSAFCGEQTLETRFIINKVQNQDLRAIITAKRGSNVVTQCDCLWHALCDFNHFSDLSWSYLLHTPLSTVGQHEMKVIKQHEGAKKCKSLPFWTYKSKSQLNFLNISMFSILK